MGAGIPISLRIFPQFVVIHTNCVINKAEVDVFLELSCFFDDVGNFISGSSAFSKSSLNIWKFMVHVLLKPGLKDFEHYFASVWDECSCAVVWAFFGIAFLWDWNVNWPFPVLWPLLSFPNLLAYCWHFCWHFSLVTYNYFYFHLIYPQPHVFGSRVWVEVKKNKPIYNLVLTNKYIIQNDGLNY